MYIVVEPFPIVKLGTLESVSPSEINWEGNHFAGVALPDDSPVFYDWDRDDTGSIVGVELYIWREHVELLGDLCRALTGREDGPLRIMFVPNAVGSSDGTQGFGDVFFYRCSRERWLIAIGTKTWLRSEDMQRLEQIAKAELR